MSLRPHLAATFWLGLPLVGAHVARNLLGVIDTVMVGRYGVEPLAALVLVVMWTIPTAGLFVSSFRDRDQISATGWWKSLSSSEQTDFVRTGTAADQKQEGNLYVLDGNVLSEGQSLVAWGTRSREPAAYQPGESAERRRQTWLESVDWYRAISADIFGSSSS